MTKYLPWVIGILAIIGLILAYQSHLKIKKIEAALAAKKCGCNGSGSDLGVFDGDLPSSDQGETANSGGVMS